MSLVSSWFNYPKQTPEPPFINPDTRVFSQNSLDAVASIIALATTAFTKENDRPKMVSSHHRLMPKSRIEATKTFLPASLDAKALPDFIHGGFQALDRCVNAQDRSLLLFFNYAIPFMNALYPTNSQDEQQNQVMKELWRYVLTGISQFEKSYATQLMSPPLANREPDGVKMEPESEPDLVEIRCELQSSSGTLPVESTMRDNFDSWKRQINEYLDPKPASPSLKNIHMDSNEGKNARTLEDVVKEFRATLDQFSKVKGKSKDLLEGIKKFIDFTLTQGSISENLNPFSHAIKQLWTIEKIKDVVEMLKAMDWGAAKEKRESVSSTLNALLDKQAAAYVALVKNYHNQVMVR